VLVQAPKSTKVFKPSLRENFPAELLDQVACERPSLNCASGLVDAGTRSFSYLYDFGDRWEHSVKVQDLVMPEAAHVRCRARENACPPEDVGGPPG